MQPVRGLGMVVLAMTVVLSLSACELSTPSRVETGKNRLQESMVTAQFDARAVDDARVYVTAENFLKDGRGNMTLFMPYPSAASADAIAAIRRQAEAYKQAFAKRGVMVSDIQMVPLLPGEEGEGQLIATYKSLSVLPPEGCTRIPGYQGADTMTADDAYSVGCEVKTVWGKMVANPADMMGRDGSQPGYGSRQGKTVDKYMTGEANQPIGGYSASEVGQRQ